MYQMEKAPFRPTQYAEHQLVTAILDGTYPPGTSLPGERSLAEQMNVTRQTVRELLQRLAGDRWITIQHGRPTIINDYWNEGGLGILKTLVNFTEYLPPAFVSHLLQARAVFLPACAKAAISNQTGQFLDYLSKARELDDSPMKYAVFDWRLQSMMAKLSGNMIYPLILNDFAPVFKALGGSYFTLQEGRSASSAYYTRLIQAIQNRSWPTHLIGLGFITSIIMIFGLTGNSSLGFVILYPVWCIWLGWHILKSRQAEN